jgi:hypothetical protein
MNFVSPYRTLIGPGTYLSRRPGSRPNVTAQVFAVSDPGQRKFRFELHCAGEVVGTTNSFRYVWTRWRCEVPLRYCYENNGLAARYTARREEELRAARSRKKCSAFKRGDLIRKGERYAIVQHVDVVKVPLDYRFKVIAREVQLRPNGRLCVTVNGVEQKARWVWTDANRLIEVGRPFWKLA